MFVKIICKTLLIALLLQGCAIHPFKVHKSELDKIQILAINVESSEALDSIELNGGYAKGKFSGAIRGAGIGALLCAGSGAMWGPLAFAFGILISPVCAIVGGIAGGIEAKSADKIEKYETEITAIDLKLNQYNFYIEQLLLEQLTESTPYLVSNMRIEDLSKLDLKADAILNVQFLNSTLSGCCINPDLAIASNYKVQLIFSATNTILFDEEISFHVGQHKLSEWAGGGASLAHSEIQTGIRELTSSILLKVFGAFQYKE